MNDEFKDEFKKTFDPNIAKFAPKKPGIADIPTIVSLIEDIREHCNQVMKLCDRLAEVANDSEDNARKAADHLLDMLKRIK